MAQPSRLLDTEILDELVTERRAADGARMRQRRTGLGLSLNQLAGLTEIGKSALCRIELGQYTPSDMHKVAIAAALVVEVADLWKPLDITEVRARALEPAA